MSRDSIRQPFDGKIDWHNNHCKISQFFTVGEVTQGDRRRIPKVASQEEKSILALAVELDKLRSEWGSPIGVTSWYRPALVNRQVGGVSNSQHILGSAADIYTMDGRDIEFEQFVSRHWGGAVGLAVRGPGRGFTHVDMRGGGWRRGAALLRWDY